jgi:hypothetical protein
VAEPWTDDLAALGERSQQQVRSIAATRAHVLSAQENSKMRFFKNRPVLAVLMVLALVGVASGAAYAVDRVFLHIDLDETAPQIQQDVTTQLQNAGVSANVQAEKSDGKIEVKIATTDPSLPFRLDFSAPHGTQVERDQGQLIIKPDVALDDAQTAQLVSAGSSSDVVAALAIAEDKGDTAPLAAAFAAHGFHDVKVSVAGTSVTVTITAPPR